MITDADKMADVMPDKDEEKVFEDWLDQNPVMTAGDWEKWFSEGDFPFYLKNRMRRAFERGSIYGKSCATSQKP